MRGQKIEFHHWSTEIMKYRYRVVDAFASGPFTGNPAAVVVLDSWPDDKWLQNVAMEMNLSETAFLVGAQDEYQLRWFTPCVEVDLCGHATLASAVALADLGLMNDDAHVKFATRSGQLIVTRRGEQYQLDFPVVIAESCSGPAGLVESLGVSALNIARNKFDYLVEVGTTNEVRAATPNFSQLGTIEARGVILTAKDDTGQYDFVSRFFAPASGINEDPVTGSAHCCLAHYWGARLNKTSMVGLQASQRGGVVQVELRADRVILSGQGFIFARGEFDS